MADEKTWVDAHKNEKLSDNTQSDVCEQCEDCIFWGNDKKDPWTNSFKKSNCDMFPLPGMKPMNVISNRGICPYWSKRENA